MRYRSKPSEIEAVQWTGDNLEEVEEFGVKFRYGPEAPSLINPLKIKAGKNGAQGYVEVPAGHWIVRQPGDLSDHWPVEASYFETKYERVEDDEVGDSP